MPFAKIHLRQIFGPKSSGVGVGVCVCACVSVSVCVCARLCVRVYQCIFVFASILLCVKGQLN